MSATLAPQQQMLAPLVGPNQQQPQTLLNNHSSEVHLKNVVPTQTRKRMAKSATGGHGRRRIRQTSKSKRDENDDQNWEVPNEPQAAKEDPQRFLSEDFLLVLDEHRKNCEREGKLDEA